jgi:type VI secretion system protein ImpF
MTGRVPLSFLDRLIDDAPDTAHEAIESNDARFDRIKLGMRRDLEGLLNSKQPYAAWGRDDALGRTITGFGLPDISTEDFGTAAVRERIKRLIAVTIRTHETRLHGVEVDVDGAPTSAGVRFRISGVIQLSDAAEAVVYDARLRPSDRVIAVDLAG